MIARIIRASIANRFWVLLAAVAILIFGARAALTVPVDFLPELGETQVIIRAPFPGKSPQLIEDQVTYPLTTALLSVPGVKTVRGYSFFGDSFVYVIFQDDVDLYWARSRVLEYLSQVQSRLPQGVRAELGPDGTGLGWVYEYALVDRTGQHDLSQLRALNDWFLKYELKTVPNVAEVASIGGMVRQYQVVLDPDKLRVFGISHAKVLEALGKANQETGGSVVEMAETEYMVRSRGYLRTLEDFRSVLLSTSGAGTPITLRDVATVRLGPEMRRGIAELNGQGEVAGGVVVMRSGKNALETIEGVRERLETLKGSLPKGVEVVPTYDRSNLINAAIHNLSSKLVEEFIAVAAVCALFLFHFRSSLVAIVSLPVAVLTAFIVMRYQGINANVMSLAGIAIAIGAATDASVVLVESAHKHLEAYAHAHPNRKITDKERWEIVTAASVEVGPALFFSLLIVALSFIPVFALQGEEVVCRAGLHQDVCPSSSRWLSRYPGSCANGLFHPRADTHRGVEPCQSRAHLGIPATT